MSIVNFTSCVFICSSLALSSMNCNAEGQTTKNGNSKLGTENRSMPVVSAEKIREALRSPEEDVSETPLGTLLIKHVDKSTKTPGRIFLNNELIYTARQEEAISYLRSGPFNLRMISFQSNGKNHPEFKITRMVIQERSFTCQYIVLDFTGPKVWISERFPKEVFQQGDCGELTWVRWKKDRAYFYFGADEQDWEKGVYRGYIEAYNPKLKAVFGPVEAPPPPKNASLVPRLKPM